MSTPFVKGTGIRINLLASGYKKLANYLADSLIFFTFYYLFAVICSVVEIKTGIDTLRYFDIATGRGFLGYTVLWLLYYFIFEFFTQRTPGKYITGTKVIANDGTKPGAVALVKRTLARLIPIDPLTFDNTLSGCWHDSLSRTIVVGIKRYDEATELTNAFNEIGQQQ